MRKKRVDEKIKNLIIETSDKVREEINREINVLKLNVERTKGLFLQSLSVEQKELYEEYEQAKADYSNYAININSDL